jgi:hypothetical protein
VISELMLVVKSIRSLTLAVSQELLRESLFITFRSKDRIAVATTTKTCIGHNVHRTTGPRMERNCTSEWINRLTV